MRLHLFAFPLLFCFHSYGQTENFKDIIVLNKIIYGLSQSGNIKLFDAQNGKQINNPLFKADSSIILISKDNSGNLVTADKSKQVRKINQERNSWELIGMYDLEPSGILVSSKGEYFSVTDEGIQDLKTKKIHFNRKSLNHQIRYKDQWGRPYCIYIDKNDIIWIGFGYGEWGGNLFAFDTRHKKFLDLSLIEFNIDLYPIKSFFEDSSAFYFSAGLDHMMTNGVIVKIDGFKASTLFKSETHWLNEEKRDSLIAGEYIGPATFSSFNNSILFYSQNGVFSGKKTKDLSTIENWTKVISPKLTWQYGQPDAVGSPMNVLKLCIIDQARFVFLSQNDGIGLYDGQSIIML